MPDYHFSVMPDQPHIDITRPALGVQVQVSGDNRVLWVHVDGITVLRICQIPRLELDFPNVAGNMVFQNEPISREQFENAANIFEQFGREQREKGNLG